MIKTHNLADSAIKQTFVRFTSTDVIVGENFITFVMIVQKLTIYNMSTNINTIV